MGDNGPFSGLCLVCCLPFISQTRTHKRTHTYTLVRLYVRYTSHWTVSELSFFGWHCLPDPLLSKRNWPFFRKWFLVRFVLWMIFHHPSGPHVLLMGEGSMLSGSLLSGEGKRFPIKSNKSTHWQKEARSDKQGTNVARHGGTRFVAEDAEFRSSTKTYTHTHTRSWLGWVGGFLVILKTIAIHMFLIKF